MRGKVVRVETLDARGQAAGGFAIRFEEYFESSEVALANYFMAEVLTKFVEEYARRHRATFSVSEMEALIDVLASWELSRMQRDSPSWSLKP